jgi:hypothetical protein
MIGRMKIPTDEQRKAWLNIAAAVFAGLTALACFVRPEGAWPLLALTVACAALANFDQIGDITATVAGVNFSLKKARTAVEQISELAARIDERNKDVVGHITGGESFPVARIIPGSDRTKPSTVAVEVVGEHSLREVDVRWINAAYDPKTTAGYNDHIGYIAARTVKLLPGAAFDARPSDDGRLDIFYSALNGIMFQFLDFRKVDEHWRFATCVLAHGRVVRKDRDDGFGPWPDWESERLRLGIELEHEPSGKIL